MGGLAVAPSERKIYAAVDELIADLDNRRGLGHEWRKVDVDTQEDMRQAWFRILRAAFDPEAAGVQSKPLASFQMEPEAPKPPACGDCRFCIPSEDPELPNAGDCRRYPPQRFYYSADDPHATMYPEVCLDDWCGEFQPRPRPVPPPETSRVRANPTHEAAP